MVNAKVELLTVLKNHNASIKCAKISNDRDWSDDRREFVLKIGASDEEIEAFFESLDFEYYNGYGGQELFGTVWLEKEGTWLARGEYDGSEWWEYNECPEIPMEMF